MFCVWSAWFSLVPGGPCGTEVAHQSPPRRTAVARLSARLPSLLFACVRVQALCCISF